MAPRGQARCVSIRALLFLIAGTLLPVATPGAPLLVSDINVQPASSNPDSFVHQGTRSLFVASTPDTGSELWVYESRSKRIERLTDVSPGPDDSLWFGRIVATGSDAAFFVTRSPVSANELWRSDGTRDGTHRVADVAPAQEQLVVSQLTALGDFVCFVVRSGSPDWELWRSDGTGAGTYPIFDIPQGTSAEPVVLGVLGPWLFIGTDSALYRSDGTPGGTVALGDMRVWSGFPGDWSEVVGDTLYFPAEAAGFGSELWRTDGTREGTRQVKNIALDGLSARSAHPVSLTGIGETLFFVAAMVRDMPMLWRSDGTEDGTLAIADDVRYGPIVATTDRIYFVRAGGTELWTTDERNGPPTFVASYRRIDLRNAVGHGRRLLFSADDGETGLEPWVSDGTAERTTILKDLNPGPVGSSPGGFTSDGERAFFSGFDGSEVEPWISDGTPDGTSQLADIAPGTESATPGGMVTLGSTVIFAADDGIVERELWRSDATADGTTLVANIAAENQSSVFPVAVPDGSAPHSFVVANERVFFSANPGFSGRELHVTDGSREGTALIADISRHSYESSSPANLTPMGNYILFTMGDNPNFDRRYGRELWRADGVRSGTALVRDIVPGSQSSWPLSITAIGDRAIFTALTAETGRELWVTSGNEATTEMVIELTPGESSTAFGSDTGSIDSLAFFAADVDGRGLELWVTDGTADGTTMVRDIAPGAASSLPRSFHPHDGGVVFVADDKTRGSELWYSNGSPDRTYLVRDLNPGPMGSNPTGFASLGDVVFFSADDGKSGQELWRSDGTRTGTFRLGDIAPGGAGSRPRHITAFADRVVFQACDRNGCEVWMSDGTARGTRLAVDINPGTGSSSPGPFLVVDEALVFTAADPTHGAELWKLTREDLLRCVGDCDGNSAVSIGELVQLVNAILGVGTANSCDNSDDAPGISQAVLAVNNALHGCPS